MADPRVLGELLRATREHAKLTLEDVAEQLAENRPGVGREWEVKGIAMELAEREGGAVREEWTASVHNHYSWQRIERFARACGLAAVPDAWYAAAGIRPPDVDAIASDPARWATIRAVGAPVHADLDAIEARAAAATPGPWRSTWSDGDRPTLADICDDEIIVEAVGRESRDRLVVGTMYYDGRWPACSEPNAAFIAAARSDVPVLTGELRLARTERDAMGRVVAAMRALLANSPTCSYCAVPATHTERGALACDTHVPDLRLDYGAAYEASDAPVIREALAALAAFGAVRGGAR